MLLQSSRHLPIGVFDSGIGGLTVLRALQTHLPHERFLYLGDTARLPYGTKSPATIQRYSLQAAELLSQRGIKCLVVACNTASATALPQLRQRFGTLPVLGVVEPGAAAGCAASTSGRIAVIATESTVQGGAYQAAIQRLRADAQVAARACPLLVALAEEGWNHGPIVEAVLQRYLEPMFTGEAMPDTLVLGCTHFPVFRETLGKVLGRAVNIVDSADTTALALVRMLDEQGLRRDSDASQHQDSAAVRFMATDGRERFARVAAYFLETPVAAEAVELVDLSFATPT